MTVESASFISGLNASYPPGSDSISEGDDHLRLIKTVLKATLPNADEAINGVHTGTTAPTPTSAGQLWFDTSGTGDLKVRNKADSAFSSVDTTIGCSSNRNYNHVVWIYWSNSFWMGFM